MPWMIKHATWLVNICLLQDDGLSPSLRRFKQYPVVGFAEFGEAVYLKVYGRHGVAEADLPFTRSMWLGRDSDS